jgi:hypothetical protein
MLLSRHQNARKNYDKVSYGSFENMANLVFGNDSNKSKFDLGGN